MPRASARGSEVIRPGVMPDIKYHTREGVVFYGYWPIEDVEVKEGLMAKVMVVVAETRMRELLYDTLTREGHEVISMTWVLPRYNGRLS